MSGSSASAAGNPSKDRASQQFCIVESRSMLLHNACQRAARSRGSGDINASEPVAVPDAEAPVMRRRLHTEPARIALAAARASQQGATAMPAAFTESFASRLQREQFTRLCSRTRHGSGVMDKDTFHQGSRERSRSVKSFLTALVDCLVKLFRPGEAGATVTHAVNCVVSDDTTTRLKAQGGPGFDQSVVFTIMNTTQNLFLRYAGGRTETVHLPTPLEVLPSGTAPHIYEAFRAWLVVSAGGVGTRLLSLGCPAGVTSAAVWKTEVLMGDALKANDTAWKFEKAALLQRRAEAAHDLSNEAHRTLGLRLKCLNHQCCLVRKPLVLSEEGYWATLVRLGNLFELNSFRRSFAGALISLLQRPRNFMRN